MTAAGDAPTPNRYEQLMRDAAWEREMHANRVRRAIENIVLSNRPGRYRLGEIITVEQPYNVPADVVAVAGSFVAEVVERVDRHTERSTWRTVFEGDSDGWDWFSIDQALIHLIALRKGQSDDRGVIVAFASRVIGFDDTPANAK